MRPFEPEFRSAVRLGFRLSSFKCCKTDTCTLTERTADGGRPSRSYTTKLGSVMEYGGCWSIDPTFGKHYAGIESQLRLAAEHWNNRDLQRASCITIIGIGCDGRPGPGPGRFVGQSRSSAPGQPHRLATGATGAGRRGPGPTAEWHQLPSSQAVHRKT